MSHERLTDHISDQDSDPMAIKKPGESSRPEPFEAQELAAAAEELVSHLHDDLPPGPASPLGGQVPRNPLRVRREADIRHLAQLGHAILFASPDERVAIRNSKHD